MFARLRSAIAAFFTKKPTSSRTNDAPTVPSAESSVRNNLSADLALNREALGTPSAEDGDIRSKQALEYAKSGDVASATEILEVLAKIDPRPRFYWLAKAELARIEGDKEKQASSLYRFSATLMALKMEILGYNKPGMHGAADLTTNAPVDIAKARLEAENARKAADFDEAIRLTQRVIDLEIADLKYMGRDVYEK
ncbi:MAG: hypothetical protein U0941_22215 [Planctomycetaceae bacterium]